MIMEVELLPEMLQYMKQQMLQNALKILLGAIPNPEAFLKSIPGKIFAFPMTTVCVWISATQ